MSIFSLGLLDLFVVSVAGIGSMKAAMERGDVDEAARQGVLAGPAVVEQAMAAPARETRLAGIAAAPWVEDRDELLPALAKVAGGPDRRTAVPAARAAVRIAKEMERAGLPDDVAAADVEEWRAAWEAIARDEERFVEVRVMALEAATALAHVTDPTAAGFDVAAMAKDPDPDVRAAAAEIAAAPAAMQ